MYYGYAGKCFCGKYTLKMFGVIFIFYCYITYYHELSSLTQYPYISSQFGGSVVWEVLASSLLRVSGGWNQIVGCPGLLSGEWGKESPSKIIWHWKNSIPCSGKTNVHISLLAFDRGLLSAPRSFSPVLVLGLVICKAISCKVFKSYHASHFSDFPPLLPIAI